MPDKIAILIDNKPVTDILSYSVDSDLFKAADAFSMDIIKPLSPVRAGMCCEIWANGSREMIGVIDAVAGDSSKKGGSRRLAVRGRDLMGRLCDHCITEYGEVTDLGGKTMKQVAEYLLRDVLNDIPQFNRLKNIIYDSGAERLAIPAETVKASPGQKVFDVLKECANSRGLHFWAREDGTFVFGKPIISGTPAYVFVNKRDGTGNVLGAKMTEDISEGFSKIIVYSQSTDDGDEYNLAATATLKVPEEFPYYLPRVVTINGDKISPDLEAKRQINIAKAKTLQLEYVVEGHSQKGINIETNKIARVDDEENDVHGEYIVGGRTFTRQNKKDGPLTQVRLSRIGSVIHA